MQVVTPALNEITSQHEKLWWLEKLEGEMVGCAPILHLDEVFADPHVQCFGSGWHRLIGGKRLALLMVNGGDIKGESWLMFDEDGECSYKEYRQSISDARLKWLVSQFPYKKS